MKKIIEFLLVVSALIIVMALPKIYELLNTLLGSTTTLGIIVVLVLGVLASMVYFLSKEEKNDSISK